MRAIGLLFIAVGCSSPLESLSDAATPDASGPSVPDAAPLDGGDRDSGSEDAGIVECVVPPFGPYELAKDRFVDTWFHSLGSEEWNYLLETDQFVRGCTAYRAQIRMAGPYEQQGNPVPPAAYLRIHFMNCCSALQILSAFTLPSQSLLDDVDPEDIVVRDWDHQATVALRGANGVAFPATCAIPEQRCARYPDEDLEIITREFPPNEDAVLIQDIWLSLLSDRTNTEARRDSPYFTNGNRLESPFDLMIVLPRLMPSGSSVPSRGADLFCSDSGLPPPTNCPSALGLAPAGAGEVLTYVIPEIELPEEIRAYLQL